jgi:DNA repair protein SbcC/Rad50
LNSASGQLVLKINDLQIKTNELDSLKASLNENKNDLKSLSLAYTLYIKNLDLANSIEDIVNKIQSENNNLSLLIEKSTEFANILNEIECNYSEEVYHQKSSKHETIKEELRNCETVINSISIEINTLNIKIEGNSINIDKFQKAQTKKFEIEKKIELTSLIRNNLKIMGQVIANKLLERIQVVATDNFQMISNRNDSVLWKSDLDEAYRVGIKFQDNRLRNFELLSGGEQMMVAISLRAAMNSLLTNSKFVIFDEPTVNLDTERRKALSESLKYILKSLDQAIIVTHDDTFMELAQNNIELQ